jgi:hypothetical protein
MEDDPTQHIHADLLPARIASNIFLRRHDPKRRAQPVRSANIGLEPGLDRSPHFSAEHPCGQAERQLFRLALDKAGMTIAQTHRDSFLQRFVPMMPQIDAERKKSTTRGKNRALFNC